MDYQDLKHSDNGMPTWDGFLGPVLQVATEKKEWLGRDLINATLKALKLPKDLLEMIYPSKYHDPIAYNRANWAMSELKIAGFLSQPSRGHYEITQAGQAVIDKYGYLKITRELTHSQPAYLQHAKKLKREKSSPDNHDGIGDQLFDLNEQQIKTWFDKQNADLQEELLTRLHRVNPYQFEQMMVTLLGKMGYKGTNGQSLVTQRSNDGGIDGIINQDALGLQTIYVQVKRYGQDNVVGSPEIDSFSGALTRKHADRGVFITTSSFTKGAKKAAKELNIALVDGDMLTNLMLQYKVGVQVAANYELLKIDDDFFEE